MNFQHYVDTHTEAYDDNSSCEGMDFDSPAFVYCKLIDLVDANSIINSEIPDIKNEDILEVSPPPQRKYTLQIYKKYGESNIAKFFELITEEGLSVPKAAKSTNIPRSTAYELKKAWNQSNGTVYPLGCIKRASKAKPNSVVSGYFIL